MDPADNTDPRAMETIVLIKNHRAGKQGAIDELFRRYEHRVRRIVCVRMGAFLRSRAEVEDIVQDTLMKAFASLDQFEAREGAQLINWLARIAENALRDLATHELAQKRDAGREVPMDRLRENSPEDSMAWDLRAPDTAPPEKAAANEIEVIVDECLQKLTDEEREIILLVDYAGGDWDYVVEQTNRPTVDAAKKFHRRARISLAGHVGGRIK
jgi:RNA polymerase sigma-70 factor (ECF subfamily)